MSGLVRDVDLPATEPREGPTASRPAKGPVRVLCDEIGFEFDPRLERQDVFVAFVRELVGEVEKMRRLAERLSEHHASAALSQASGVVLGLAHTMLEQRSREGLISAAGAVHDASRELSAEGSYPTDHLIDMLLSCASATRFGLENGRWGVGSRHAAHAAQHVFGNLYGLRLHDSRTPAREKEWARSKLLSAIVSLLPPPDGAGGDPRPRSDSPSNGMNQKPSEGGQ